MITDTELAELKDALRETEARLNALGAFQIAIGAAIARADPALSEALFQQLDLAHRLAKDAGENANAAVIMKIVQQLHEQISLQAND